MIQLCRKEKTHSNMIKVLFSVLALLIIPFARS